MKKNLLSLVIATILAFFSMNMMAQVGVNTDGTQPDNSAMLNVKSTSKGFLPPRMSDTEMRAIFLPANGLIVYNVSLNALYWYNGSSWQRFNDISIIETDLVFAAHPSSAITSGNVSEWNTAFAWGNNAGLYEPLISKSPGYARWTGTAWSFSNDTYSLSNHNHLRMQTSTHYIFFN